jgi:hypothetical protein
LKNENHYGKSIGLEEQRSSVDSSPSGCTATPNQTSGIQGYNFGKEYI